MRIFTVALGAIALFLVIAFGLKIAQGDIAGAFLVGIGALLTATAFIILDVKDRTS